jgi:methylmalonyl-CoA mutase C-terminal domain/subunit
MTAERRIRILLAKPGLDALHDRGYFVVGRAMREAGMEVIMAGKYLTADQIAQAAVQEDVDFIGISLLSGTPLAIIRRLVERLKELGGENIPIMLGGIIPEKEKPELEELGVTGFFGPGSPIDDILEYINRNLPAVKE